MRKVNPRKVRASERGLPCFSQIWHIWVRHGTGPCGTKVKDPSMPETQAKALCANHSATLSTFLLKLQEKGRCPFKTKLHSLHHLILLVASTKCDPRLLCLLPNPISPFLYYELSALCTFLSLEKRTSEDDSCSIFVLNANRNDQTSDYFWWAGGSRAGVAPSCAEQVYSPWRGEFLTLLVIMAECHFDGMLSQSLRTQMFPLLWAKEDYCTFRQHVAKW